MKPEQQKALREPFPKSAIGRLPKGGAMLDYVGHAAVTSRLLEVDPEWSWEPLALDPTGLPLYDVKGGLWIRLTIGGVTRLGYGDGPDPKQRIGDAIRNAAMRFGVALDLWAKEDITETTTHTDETPLPARQPRKDSPWVDGLDGPPSPAQTRMMFALLKGDDGKARPRDESLAIIAGITGREVESSSELTKGEVSAVIEALKAAAA